MQSGRQLYRGDVVALAYDPLTFHGVIRKARGQRVQVQAPGQRPVWASPWGLVWTGWSLERLPRTPWGWRQVGPAVRKLQLVQDTLRDATK